jgi:hypothetical protein
LPLAAADRKNCDSRADRFRMNCPIARFTRRENSAGRTSTQTSHKATKSATTDNQNNNRNIAPSVARIALRLDWRREQGADRFRPGNWRRSARRRFHRFQARCPSATAAAVAAGAARPTCRRRVGYPDFTVATPIIAANRPQHERGMVTGPPADVHALAEIARHVPVAGGTGGRGGRHCSQQHQRRDCEVKQSHLDSRRLEESTIGRRRMESSRRGKREHNRFR